MAKSLHTIKDIFNLGGWQTIYCYSLPHCLKGDRRCLNLNFCLQILFLGEAGQSFKTCMEVETIKLFTGQSQWIYQRCLEDKERHLPSSDCELWLTIEGDGKRVKAGELEVPPGLAPVHQHQVWLLLLHQDLALLTPGQLHLALSSHLTRFHHQQGQQYEEEVE